MDATFKFSNYNFENFPEDPNITITSVISTQSAQSAIDAVDTLPIVRSCRPAEPPTKSRIPSLSTFSAIFLMINSALGAGLFNLPEVFYRSGGFSLATAIQLVILIFIVGSLLMLSYCTDKYSALSYHELIDKALGQRWANLCTATLVVYSYGCCLTFLLLIQDQFQTAFASYFGSDYIHTWYLHPVLATSVCALLFILPFCFTNRLDLLKYPSSCGVVIIAYIVGLVYLKYKQTVQHYPVEAPLQNWTDIFTCVPAICFSYQCHINWVPTHAEMRCKTCSRKTIFTVLTSCAVCAFAYTFVSYAGIATFGGEHLSADLIRNYDARLPFVLIGIVLFAFKIVVTYPIVLFCAREAIVDQLEKRPNLWPTCLSGYERHMITLSWFISALVISIITPDIGYVISLLGTLAVLFMFILPGMCLVQVVRVTDPEAGRSKTWLLHLIGGFFIVLGILVFILTTVQTINMFIHPIEHEH